MYTGLMVRRILLLVTLLLGQNVLASVPMDCGAPAQEPPCHGEQLEQSGADISCEIRCAICGPVMLAAPEVQTAPPESRSRVSLELADLALPPPDEIFHPPISP